MSWNNKEESKTTCSTVYNNEDFLIMYTRPLPNHCSIHMTITLTLKVEKAKCIDLRQYRLCKTRSKTL